MLVWIRPPRHLAAPDLCSSFLFEERHVGPSEGCLLARTAVKPEQALRIVSVSIWTGWSSFAGVCPDGPPGANGNLSHGRIRFVPLSLA